MTATLCFALVGTAGAQEGSHAEVRAARPVGDYAGVRPGSPNAPPRQRVIARALASTPPVRLLTWPGFVPAESRGGGRFFVQLTAQTSPETRASEGRFEIILPGVVTHLRNTRRPLLTQFFNTPVVKAEVEIRGRRRDRHVAIVFTLRAPVTPQVSASLGEGGYYFVFIEFPPGDYLPEELRRPTEPAPDPMPTPTPRADDAADVPSNEEMRRMDTERPPGM